MLVVYSSSATRNTERFVEKLDLPNKRIPLHKTEPPLVVDEPYVLICPTYGGGASISGVLAEVVVLYQLAGRLGDGPRQGGVHRKSPSEVGHGEAVVHGNGDGQNEL